MWPTIQNLLYCATQKEKNLLEAYRDDCQKRREKGGLIENHGLRQLFDRRKSKEPAGGGARTQVKGETGWQTSG